MSESAAIDYAGANRERFVDDLKELLSIPSISTLPDHRPDMERAAGWLKDRLSNFGLQAEVIKGKGHPLVYAEWLQAAGSPTILVYGHYDVQPVDPVDLWETPPFEPTVRNGGIYARGASDDKGQVMTLVNAAESLLKSEGKLPLNLKFIFEGEEECGGETIEEYVRASGNRLEADVVQVADSHLFAQGIPTLESGLRGILYTEIHVQGAEQDLHSGLYGGVAPNPLNALAHIIAGLKNPEGRITIPRFYEAVRMPSDDVLASWRELPLDPDEYRREEVHADELVGEAGFTELERTWARPTLDVHGISGGFTGVGAKTVIPAVASAKISMRLVPEQRAEEIFEIFRQRVLDLKPPGVGVDVRRMQGNDPVLVNTESPLVQAARRALEKNLRERGGAGPLWRIDPDCWSVQGCSRARQHLDGLGFAR